MEHDNEKRALSLEEILAKSKKVSREWASPKSYEEGKSQLQRLRGYAPRSQASADRSRRKAHPDSMIIENTGTEDRSGNNP